ncbi:NAD(P)/FAD-dependent oxidoreductase [Vulgatibacter sp.]|uniref:NAD(P)/FAD-dependent oxidoreductase n=1 Tax=Vulgatibacter sp. TaxID=1971226 RepID=UPI00356A65AB
MNEQQAAAIVREAGGEELLERLLHLDRTREASPPEAAAPRPPDAAARPDYDVALVGGGLSILHAPLLAAAGLRVAVFERRRAAVAHREWNASGPELQALVDTGLLRAEALDELVVARYDHGTCAWHGGASWPVEGVLDHAVDAGGLLQLARRLAEEAGVAFFDGHELAAHAAGPGGIVLRFRNGADATARILLDGRGASSPFATADLTCPTVGGVIAGIEEGSGAGQIDPRVGEILASTEGVEAGRQHVWEAFPGRPGETTVYLFHYAFASSIRSGELLRLYARFFETLPRYKRGATRLVRPTFGFIPGWSRLAPPPAPPGPRIALVGDAAARHSPLTFCGFGATLRSLGPVRDAVVAALADGDFSQQRLACIVDDRPIHRGTGALALLLASPPQDPAQAAALNELLDTAFGTLHGMGPEAYAALLRDEMAMGDFVRFLHRTSLRRPRVYRDVFARLGAGAVGRWGLRMAGALAPGGRSERNVS